MQNRKIIRGVRIDNKVYTTGQEDALFAAVDIFTLSILMNSGAIVGEWLPEAIPADGGNDGDPLILLKPLGEEIIDELIAGGYDTVPAINAATDDELKALPKIGAATVKKIRDLLK